MGQLSSNLELDDFEVLLEAMNDWETIGNGEFHAMNMIRSMPIPPENHEYHEYIVQIKDHFRKREKDIKDSRAVRLEKATFIKTKLMIQKRDAGINKLFEDATAPIAVEPTTSVKSSAGTVVQMDDKDSQHLKMAEAFISDMSVWTYYNKFLTDRTLPERIDPKTT